MKSSCSLPRSREIFLLTPQESQPLRGAGTGRAPHTWCWDRGTKTARPGRVRRTGADSRGSGGSTPPPAFKSSPPPGGLSSAARGDSHLHTFGKDVGFVSEGGISHQGQEPARWAGPRAGREGGLGRGGASRGRGLAGAEHRGRGLAGRGLAGRGLAGCGAHGAGPPGSPGGARAKGVRGGRALSAASCQARGLSPSSARWRLCNCHTLSCRRWAGVTAAAFSGPRAAICSADSSCSGERGQHPQGGRSAGSPNLGRLPWGRMTLPYSCTTCLLLRVSLKIASLRSQNQFAFQTEISKNGKPDSLAITNH